MDQELLEPSCGGKRKHSKRVAEVGPVQVVDGYEKIMLEDSGFKKRSSGRRHCTHGRFRRKAGEIRSVSTAVDAANASSAGEHRSVSMVVYAAHARRAGEHRSVSTVVYAAHASSAGDRRSASTAVDAAHAKNAGGHRLGGIRGETI